MTTQITDRPSEAGEALPNGSIDLSWLVSVDDHVVEPGDLWTRRLPKDADRVPRLVVEDGTEQWVYEDRRIPTHGLSVAAGRDKETLSPDPLPYAEMRPGCYDPVARLEDMDRAGILSSMCFPTVPRFCGQLFNEAADKGLAMRCLTAYNDWTIEDWCGAAPGRYIPLMLIPLWDPMAAAREVERCAARGVHALAFTENPAPLGLPTIHDPSGYWDPLFAAATETRTVVCMHVGSSSQIPKISPDAPFVANLSWGASRTAGTMLSWLFSGYFTRFPSLRIALSEGGIGWIPYFLERAEQVVDKAKYWADRSTLYGHAQASGVSLRELDIRALYREHVFGCFIEDQAGVNNLDVIGEDNVMVETDYPHNDTTWPNSISVARHQIAALPELTQRKLLRGNAERLFRFTPAEPPAR